MTDPRLASLERTNRRLTLAVTALGGLLGGAVLAGLAQPDAPASARPVPARPAYVGLTTHEESGFLYRLRSDGVLERLSLERGRVSGGGTPAVWNEFPVGQGVRNP